MELSIQEQLKDLRVEHWLTPEQLEEQGNLSKTALGSYEAKDFKDISHYALIKLAKFYGVTADYLPELSEEEKKWLKKIAQKSDLLKHPNPQRGRK